MTLDRLLRFALPAVVASFYACGSEEPAPTLGSNGAVSQPCHSDVECKGERVCVEGYCKDPAGSAEGPCGNSPLTGKYLWQTSCDMAMEKPFAPDCTGELITISSRDGVEIVKAHRFTYAGLTLSFPEGELGESTHQFELKRSFSRADLTTGDCAQYNSRYDNYQCAITHSDAYILAVDTKICFVSKLFFIKDNPWPGDEQRCRDEMRPLVTSLEAQCPISEE